MKLIKDNNTKVILILFKEFNKQHTVTSLSNKCKLTRVGVWKILKKLEKGKLISLKKIGNGKTNPYFTELNWENTILEKKISLALLEESMEYQRWIENFNPYKDSSYFILLYGSILISSKDVNDIDLICVAEKEKFNEINLATVGLQRTMQKKIHLIVFTKHEFAAELKKPNEAFIDAVRKGILLFGQENFIKLMRDDLKNDRYP